MCSECRQSPCARGCPNEEPQKITCAQCLREMWEEDALEIDGIDKVLIHDDEDEIYSYWMDQLKTLGETDLRKLIDELFYDDKETQIKMIKEMQYL